MGAGFLSVQQRMHRFATFRRPPPIQQTTTDAREESFSLFSAEIHEIHAPVSLRISLCKIDVHCVSWNLYLAGVMASDDENVSALSSVANGKESSEKDLSYDDVLERVGSFGKYQKLVFFCVLVPVIFPSGFLAVSSIFLAATPEFHCSVPGSENATSWTYDYSRPDSMQKISRVTVWEDAVWEADRSSSKSCDLCSASYSDDTDALFANYTFSNNSGVCKIPDHSRRRCDFGVEFSRDIFETTVVTEWDLVCDKKWQGTLTIVCFYGGGVCGPLLWGFLADRIGRKKGFFACVLFQSIFNIATFWAPNFIVYCIFRFCVGMTTSAGYILPFVMTLEIVGKEQRALLSVCCSFCYSIGCSLFLIIAYFVRTWRYLALVSSSAAVVLYGSVWWFFPESPRWLLGQGRHEELAEFLRKVSKINGRPLSPEIDARLPVILRKVDKEDHRKKHSVIDLFRTSNMRKKTIILILLNCCNKAVSIGLNLYTPRFSRNPYLSALLNTMVEFPPYLFARYAFDRLGRRSSLFCGLSLGAVFLLTGFAISRVHGEKSAESWVLGFSLLAKFCITFTYLNGKLLEDEMFPTVVRGEGHSMVSVVSSMLSCGSPFIVDLGHDYKVLPLPIFGCLCLVCSFTVFFLPETAHQRLPQTLEDGENFGKNMTWKEKFRFLPKREKKTKNGDLSEMENLKVTA